jgi:iron complex transport system ATP-binding protein
MRRQPSSILLNTTNLTIGYQSALLENLNLELRAGELVCFMGPNGIGKSTLIRTLAGLQSPRAGSVHILGGTRVNKLAVVLTEKISASHMTVRDLVTFGRYPYLNWSITLSDHDTRIIDEAIDMVRIRDLSQKKLHQLSDGQVQMAMLARALAQETPIILLDEPTAHLDLNNRIEIMRLLRNLAHKTNRAILVATHELDLALQTTDRIWLTGKNKNVITGIPEDLVLNGTFDDIFQFKGFDLKTGKVQHESHTGKTIQLTGSDADHLWTKNALERNGFEVYSVGGHALLTLQKNNERIEWIIGGRSFTSLEELLIFLNNTSNVI